MNACPLTLLCLLLTGTAFAADSQVPPLTTTEPVDLKSEALPILQAKYPGYGALQVKEGDHLNDLIARSGGKISLRTGESGVAAAVPPIMTVALPDNIAYWRLESFTPPATWPDLAGQLRQTKVSGVVIDLRSNLAPDDYSGAAQALEVLAPADPTLKSFEADAPDAVHNHPPAQPFPAPLVVLTDNRTSGAAEALAECLKDDGALVVGQPTAGKMGIFTEQKLSSGQLLRYFTSPVLSDSEEASSHARTLSWGQPVLPDIGITVTERADKAALVLIDRNRILDVIKESDPRRRLSEATLVQGVDPEWDAYLAGLEAKTDDLRMQLPPVRDIVLIAALDNLKAIQLSQRPPLGPIPPAAHPATAASIQ